MKKKLLTLIIAVISVLCCAFAFTACDNKNDNGELVVPGNSFVCTEIILEYTEKFYSLSENEQEQKKALAEECWEYFADSDEVGSIWKFNTNGTFEISFGVTTITGYYKIDGQRISSMMNYDTPTDISEVNWNENTFGIITDSKIKYCTGGTTDNEYFTIYNVLEKI